MRIDVTAEAIRRGVRGEPGFCAIAIALQEATGQPWEVGCVCAWRTDLPASEATRLLPRHVEQWVKDFDDGKAVRPFSFEF